MVSHSRKMKEPTAEPPSTTQIMVIYVRAMLEKNCDIGICWKLCGLKMRLGSTAPCRVPHFCVLQFLWVHCGTF